MNPWTDPNVLTSQSKRYPVGTVIRSFEWDAADRLKAIVSGSQRIEWTYNSQGQKVLQSTNGIATKRYLWDGSSLLLEKSPTGVVTKRFYADGEQRIGGTDAGNYFYTRDHLGSIREVVNQAGALQARYDYDAYGKRSILSQNPTYLNGCPFGYTSHLTLPSLTAGQGELVLTHYRAYDPQLGRWLSPDPIGEAGGMNLYGYVLADPVNGWDPYGLEFWTWGASDSDDWFPSAGEMGENMAQFSMGMADNLSFGLNGLAREAIYGANYSDPCSKSYKGGEWTGTGVSMLAGGAGGLRAAGSKSVGKEFSHWIPDRVLKKSGSKWLRNTFGRSRGNGNYVSSRRHAKHDPMRMLKGDRGMNGKFPTLLRQLDRIPNLIKGGAAGLGYGLGGQAATGGCD